MIAPIAKAESSSKFDSNEPVLGLKLKSEPKENSTLIAAEKDNEVTHLVEEAMEKLTGIVSWYADKFHGQKTSSGELYNKNTYTAAHKSLPFGTKVKVTNVKNGKSVVVKINDRGPHSKSRILDLSKAAFTEIGSIDSGILRVEMEVVD